MSTVNISVVTSENTVISGATVTFSGASTTTNSLGVATFEDVEQGVYSFTATANGYESGVVALVIDGENDATGIIILEANAATLFKEALEELKDGLYNFLVQIGTSIGDLTLDSFSDLVDEFIVHLKSEIETTDSKWVKIRDIIELFGADTVYPIFEGFLKALYSALLIKWVTKLINKI